MPYFIFLIIQNWQKTILKFRFANNKKKLKNNFTIPPDFLSQCKELLTLKRVWVSHFHFLIPHTF